ELKSALKRRRQHQDTGGKNALLALQHACDLGRAESAVAFAEDEFGRAGTAVFGDVERDDLGHGFRIAMNGPEGPRAVRLGGAARPGRGPAGAISTRWGRASQVPGLWVGRAWGRAGPWAPKGGMRGPTRQRWRKAGAAPGPPLKTKVTGRAAVFADFAIKAV